MARAGGEMKWGVTVNKYRASFWGDEHVLKSVVVVAAVRFCEYTKNQLIVTLKYYSGPFLACPCSFLQLVLKNDVL